MNITKLSKLVIPLGISLVLANNNLSAQAISITYNQDFAPLLPSTFNPSDSFNLQFKIHDPNRSKAIHIAKIFYHVVTPVIANIFIPLYFSNLSPDSSSQFTLPPGSTQPDGADLTLAGLGGFATTNSFIPYNFGITRSDILAANLSFQLETEGLVVGDGIVASLQLNGESLGSPLIAEPVPEPLTMTGLAIGTGFGAFLKNRYSKKEKQLQKA